MIANIQNKGLACVGFCQNETNHLIDPRPTQGVILGLIRRILVVASLIIPLIGLIANCLRTETIYLGFSQLTVTPDVSHNPNLQYLLLSNNQLSQAPDVRHNPNLEGLELSYNQLTQAPDVSHNPDLRQLWLNNNRLSQAPDVSYNPNLRQIRLHYNLLESLPDSILTLHRSCNVYAENNLFTAAYVAEFQDRLAAQRLRDPNTGPTVQMSVHDAAARAVAVNTLEEELAFWSQGVNPPIDFAPLTSLDAENRSYLLTYLTKLKQTADYRDVGDAEKKARNNIILRAQNMLKLACEKQEFKNILFSLLEEGSTTCGDRVILYFNDIEVQSQVYKKEHNEQEFVDLAVKIQRYELLKTHAKRKALAHQLGDEVETILYYQIKLITDLSLPITTRGMLYPSIAGVNEQMLEGAKSEIMAVSPLDLLAKSDLWRARLHKENPEPFNAIEEESASQIDQLSEGLTSQVQRNRCEQIQRARNSSLEQLARELTLQKHLRLE